MDKKNIALGLAGAALIYDGVVTLHNRKIRAKRNKRIEKLEQLAVINLKTIVYLTSKMEAHNVPMSEFDMIALNDIMKQS
jgi:hypothetical protein